MNPILIQLTCKDQNEASVIIDELLLQGLIACAKVSNITSKFVWKENIESSSEVLITMDSVQANFAEIDKIVAGLHSYEIYNLVATRIDLMNSKTEEWIRESSKKKN
jgi:periplasmic divalent cation tolerance protein